MFSKDIFLTNLNTLKLGREISCVGEISSTNDHLLANDCLAGEVIVASYQTKGRGRSGRTWINQANSLMFSVNIPLIEPKYLMPLNIIAGFALVDTLKEFADVRLKWPNDCVIDGKKICGMLIETRFLGARVEKCVLGIGINLFKDDKPDEISQKATSLEENLKANKEIQKEIILTLFLKELEEYIEKLKNSSIDISSLFPYYSANAGKEIKIHRNGAVFSCVENGIDEDGSLIVKLSDGSFDKIHSGEIGYDFDNRYR